MIEPISIETARRLLDFTGGRPDGLISANAAEEQLTSAVAVHNLLAQQKVAYLADEVGMGKTYVALGAVALLRHFRPHLRILVIAPRENIQDKWMREWRYVVRHVVRVEDLSVKGIGAEPARALVKTVSLSDLATKVSRDHDRDFFARLTSFSLPIANADDRLHRQRQEITRVLPWLKKDLLELKSKETFKRHFGMAVNCALPAFDLVIVDEAHNLKGGWKPRGATRNLVLGCALGGKDAEEADSMGFRGYGLKARRVLFLSATPIEHDFGQLWNQLDLLGHGSKWKKLADRECSDEERREIVRELLIRRVGRVKCGAESLTKNQYRREWRSGGSTTHDEPLHLPNDRQKLAVALIQKKVAEVLGHGEHNHSFQVGLLASFESFEQTATHKLKAVAQEEAAEADDDDKRAFYTHRNAIPDEDLPEGADINVVDRIAKDYQRRFDRSLPHPKMDALVDTLEQSLVTGQKALVFVRRVASVDELQRKLEEQYDKIVFDRLRRDLRAPIARQELEQQIGQYLRSRAADRQSRRVTDEANVATRAQTTPEVSSTDSFFAWFFRGEGPADVLSGARLAERLDSASGDYSTLFEDNHVAAILDVGPQDVLEAMAAAVGLDVARLRVILKERARAHLPASSKTITLVTFRAFQRACLEILRDHSERFKPTATAMLLEVFADSNVFNRASTSPEPDKWVALETFFTALRSPQRAALRDALWPASKESSAQGQIRESEIRRMLIAAMARKGHPIIDLFVIVANRVRTLALRKRDVTHTDLATEFLDLLDAQRQRPGFSSFSELADAASNFRLLLTQNLSEVQEATPLSQVPTLLGRLLRSQKPVGGMAGSINNVMVRQFRMPGYPLVLVSTDLLQEGEDLHTFCSSIFHYGIAWMPSALEQRVGRIDRIGSQTERRLAKLAARPEGRDRLQVFYPHLRDTVEVLQVRRVLHRLNRFLKLMHANLGLPEPERPSIDLKEAMLLPALEAAQLDEPLESAFDVTPAMLAGRTLPLSGSVETARDCEKAFADIGNILQGQGIEWLGTALPNQRSGMRLMGRRRQPFTLLLRSLRGRPLLRCVSPVGEVRRSDFDAESIAEIAREPLVRVSLVLDERIDTYEVAVEGDIVFDPQTHRSVSLLVRSVTDAADRIEALHLEDDPHYGEVTTDLAREADVER